MKKVLGILILSVFFLTNAFSQASTSVKVKKRDFYTTDVDFKQAWKNYKKGNKYYKENQKGSFKLAITPYLLEAYKYNPNYPVLNYQLGVSYVINRDKTNGLKYMKAAYNLDPDVSEDIHYWLGRAYHLNGEFETAIVEYKKYRDALSKSGLKDQAKHINKFILQCDNGVKMSDATETNVFIDNMGKTVNSEYADYGATYASEENVVYFTSRRPIYDKKNRQNVNVGNEFFEDIFSTEATDGKWQTAERMGRSLNRKGNDAVVSINAKGDEMIIYRGKKNAGNVYKKVKKIKKNGKVKWSCSKKVSKRINRRKARETSVAINSDTTMIVFVSDRKRKAYGGKDIWMLKKKEGTKNRWYKPVNLGKNVNSIYNEETVFFSANDSILYFASEGHTSIGGYDIFMSKMQDNGSWGEAENMGAPLNTPGDDMFMVVGADNRTGFYTSSGQDDNYGDLDVYEFFFYTPKKANGDSEDNLIAFDEDPRIEVLKEDVIAIKTMRMTVVKGFVTEYETNKPLLATIEITDNATQEKIETITTIESTGAYTIMLPSGKDYGISVGAEDHMFHSENFNIPKVSQYQEIHKDISLLPVNTGAKIVLRNVFFDTGKSTLRPASYPELNKLADAFKKYPKLVVEISGHTDSQGSATTNQRLSQNRAQSVVDYLISIGVEKTHLYAKGYGEDQPVADNKTAEGRQLNRRVEAKIISN